jgi:hypothetical protein
MIKNRIVVAALASAIALSSASYAIAKEKASVNPSMGVAERDYTKLSEDGFNTFRNVHLSRLALFDGKVDQAKKYLSNARTSLTKAEADESTFMAAMADIKQPAGATNEASADYNKPIKWVPVDAQMTLTDDYAVTPENHTAVAKANDKLKKGDRKGAINTLKLAGVDLQYSTVLLPIEQTKDALQSTAEDISNDKYYQANLSLKSIEDSMTVDVVDVIAQPEAAKAEMTTEESTSSAQATNANADHNKFN